MKTMDKVKLKVCGLTQLEQIEVLVKENIDFLGFIFYPKSPRFVLNHLNLEEIGSVNHLGKVGVFVNESLSKIVEISEKAKLNFIQLHGEESVDYIKDLKTKLPKDCKIIKVFRVGIPIEFTMNFNAIQSKLESLVDFYLFDTDSKAYGGTGKTFSWRILDEINIKKPYFLSGGISQNHAKEFQNLKHQPFGLDINSKFEINPGNKNLELIKEFKKHIHTL